MRQICRGIKNHFIHVGCNYILHGFHIRNPSYLTLQLMAGSHLNKPWKQARQFWKVKIRNTLQELRIPNQLVEHRADFTVLIGSDAFELIQFISCFTITYRIILICLLRTKRTRIVAF